MSQPDWAAGKPVEEAESQTPVSKSSCPVCPPTPIKENQATKQAAVQRPSLTDEEVRQLQKSWSDAVKESLGHQ